MAGEVHVEVGELHGAVRADGEADVGVAARAVERLVGAELRVGAGGEDVQRRLRDRVAAAELPRQRAAAAVAGGDVDDRARLEAGPLTGAGGETVCGASKAAWPGRRIATWARQPAASCQAQPATAVPSGATDSCGCAEERGVGGDRAGGAARAVGGDERRPDALERLVPADGEDDRVAVLVEAGGPDLLERVGGRDGGGRAEALGQRGGGRRASRSGRCRRTRPGRSGSTGRRRTRVVGALHAAEAVAGASAARASAVAAAERGLYIVFEADCRR